jgi:hypothetical protein
VSIPSSVISIADGAFYGCSRLTSVSIPLGVTSIGSYAFQYCSGLTGVTIPAGVTNIGPYAFYGCSRLTGVTIPSSVTSIGDYAYYGCSGLTNVTIPTGVTSIGSSAFSGCSGLTSVSIPTGVNSIGSGAFYGCRGLTSISIPSTVTSIGSNAFQTFTIQTFSNSSGSGLVSITVDPANLNYSSLDGVLFDKLQATLIQCPKGKSGAYIIPPSVTSIATYAFYYCSGLTSVSIPTGTTSIGTYAFQLCKGLTSISIPSSVTSIGTYAFQACTGLVSITVDPANLDYSSSDGVLFDKLQTSLIQCPIGKSGDYTIPSSVTNIGSSALTSCSGLTSVLIPAGVISIGTYAFQGCSGLTSISIPAGVISIGTQAFQGCSGLVSISVDPASPTYSSNSDGVLFDKPQTSLIQCPGGKNGAYAIPSSITSIGDYAFYGCGGLTSVSIPPNVTSIGTGAFFVCAKLMGAIFMGNAPALGSSAFASVASGFTVYYLNGSSGFTSPTWQGYAAFPMQGPQFTSSPPTTNSTTGVSYHYSCTATGAPPPAFAVTSGALPDGLSISSAGVISGTPTVAGTFSGTIAATNGTSPDATQAFTITINTALQSWRQTNFGTTANTGAAADNAVSNLDGLPNLLEYALGGTPTVANSAIRPSVSTVTNGGANYLALTFTPQRAEITYAIEVSGNLTGAWTSIPLTGLLTMGQAYTYTDTVAVAARAPRFIRLRVSGQ